jgi:citrate lyase beta subunit
MRHFDFLSEADRQRLFLQPPQPFSATDDLTVLGMALGATLYSPATRPALFADLAKRTGQGVLSTVICLEDSIPDEAVPAAEQHVIEQLRAYARSGGQPPLVFIRVRSAAQIPMIVAGLGEQVAILAGFVLPKFTDENGERYLDAISEASAATGHRLLAMPVLEAPPVIFAESRRDVLLRIRQLLNGYRDQVVAVRIGATDLSSTFGLRRSRELTIYDVRVVADVIADVVNILGRADDSGFVVTGAVWEYFSGTERMFKPQLREAPFIEHSERALRTELIARDLDGLIREIALDKANGLTGKTVIHPSHVAAVHALSVVTHEEFCDARDVLGTRSGGGVTSSAYGNKMNESKPHSAWARRTVLRASVFGVANAGISFVDLLSAGLHQ